MVFGSSTAGGAYQPGMSDYNIVIKKQSKIFLAGPPLVKMATGEKNPDDESLGGAQMHAEISGLGEYLAEDERDALRLCREVVSHLNWKQDGTARSSLRVERAHPRPRGVVGVDESGPAAARSMCGMLIGRVVDGSRFEEFKPRYGATLVCGWASIHGYPIGILGNNGVLDPAVGGEGRSLRPAQQPDRRASGLPAKPHGFRRRSSEFEQAGIIKKGSQMINAVTNSTVPHLTVIIGNSYGAGTYAMSGRAFNNRFTFIWPSAKIAVMGGKQIAGVMSIVRRRQAARKGEPFDEEADAQMLVAAVEDIPGASGSVALEASRRHQRRRHHRSTRHPRTVLGICLSVVRNTADRGRRRLWSIPTVSFHDASRFKSRRDRAEGDSQRTGRWGFAVLRSMWTRTPNAPFVCRMPTKPCGFRVPISMARTFSKPRSGHRRLERDPSRLRLPFGERGLRRQMSTAAGIAWVGTITPETIEQHGGQARREGVGQKSQCPHTSRAPTDRHR